MYKVYRAKGTQSPVVCVFLCLPSVRKSRKIRLSRPVALTRAGLVPTSAHTWHRWEFKATKKKRKTFFLYHFLGRVLVFLLSCFLL